MTPTSGDEVREPASGTKVRGPASGSQKQKTVCRAGHFGSSGRRFTLRDYSSLSQRLRRRPGARTRGCSLRSLFLEGSRAGSALAVAPHADGDHDSSQGNGQ